jgi:hypothetical protein
MRRIVLILLFQLFFFVHAAATDLRKLALDDVASIGLKIQADSVTKIEGQGSIKITTLWPTTVCLGQVSGLDVENAKLVYSARVKSDINGEAYLEMWALIAGRHYFSKGMNNPIKGRSEWQTLQTLFMLKKGQQPDNVTLNIVVNGTGTVWIDDIRLSKESLR